MLGVRSSVHFFFTLHALASPQSGVDLFSSVSDLRNLLRTERRAVGAIGDLLEAEHARLYGLELIHRNLVEKPPAPADMQDPVRRFHMLAAYAWQVFHEITSAAKEHKDNFRLLIAATRELAWPIPEDLEGAADGLCRLVQTYNISNRVMNRLRFRALPEPKASDLLEVASNCLDSYAQGAVTWVKLVVVEDSRRQWKTATEILSRALFSLGNTAEALEMAAESLAYPPESPSATELSKSREKVLRRKHSGVAPKEDDAAWFQSLCVEQGDIHAPPEASKHLHCRMMTGGGAPWLIPQPIKMEAAYPDPKIIFFHDFLTRKECDKIRSLAQRRLVRALVHINSTQQPVKYRISKAAYLEDHSHVLLLSLTHRISLVTGLSLASAEAYQVVNYGVGGHYVPHYDFFPKQTLPAGYQGPEEGRIATFLIYLSDIAAGGATAFLGPRIAVKPRMGMAVLWFNLVRPKKASDADHFSWSEARQGDRRTRHGSCPVLEGSKWIITKWIHEQGQGVVNYDLY